MKVSVLILTSMLATVTTQIAASPISISTYLDPSTSSISSSLSSSFTFLSSLLSPRLIQTSSDSSPFWSIELHKSYLLYRNTHFIDLTDNQQLGQLSQSRIASSPPSFPDKPAYKDQLEHLLKQVSEKGPRANLEEFTAFYNRYYKSDYGKQSQKWLLNTLNKTISSSSIENITLKEFSHPWGQNSIILHIPGSDRKLSKEKGVTILGAHQDSTAFISFLRAPGADDDASGVVTLLETLRVLLLSSFQPLTPLEFHFYSAEEGGLLGSQAVASSYELSSIKVQAMLQQDMTAFVKPGTEERAGLVSDFTSPDLTKFISMLVSEYTYLKPTSTKLGYAASDHASWTKIGVPAAFAVEAPYEDCNLQKIHTAGDRFDIPEYSFKHLLQFVRLSSAFAVELTGWT